MNTVTRLCLIHKSLKLVKYPQKIDENIFILIFVFKNKKH